MKSRVLDYIDFDSVNDLLEGFYQSTGFVTAIVDLEGNVLSKSGWRRICNDFHRINSGTAENCFVSDTVLANSIKEIRQYHAYKCLNGLVDVVVPILIKGEHIANLFSGQFFFEEPDLSFFKKQSEEYGFDEAAYLKAIMEVPVVPQEKVRSAMDFLLNMTRLISDITMQKLEQAELYATIKKSEEKLREAQEMAHLGFWSWDVKTGEVEWSDEVYKIFCIDPKEFTPKIDSILELSPWPEDHQRDRELINRAIETHAPGTFEQRFMRPDNTIGYYYSTFQGVYDDAGGLVTIVGTVLDITDRKQVEIKVNQQLTELKRWQEVTLGREGRILEMKAEVNELLAQMGMPPRYANHGK